MSEQVINQEFNTYFKLLTKDQKESILLLIKSFVNRTNRISVEQYNNEIDAAEARISQGLYISHEEIEKESKEW
ncbi:MAG: hypothetical protein H8D45_20005 [Bacteroidetes bacterium]|nr:hypothetical protein [Bacteroidota bacterium]MBL7104124.1 hypothetical protein [Bacteroidales bacterium]